MTENLRWSSKDHRPAGEKVVGGKIFKMLVNSSKMRCITVEMEPKEMLEGRKVHKGEEFKYVLEGEVVFIVGNESIKLGPGEWLWHSSEIPHSARNEGTVTTKYMTVATHSK